MNSNFQHPKRRVGVGGGQACQCLPAARDPQAPHVARMCVQNCRTNCTLHFRFPLCRSEFWRIEWFITVMHALSSTSLTGGAGFIIAGVKICAKRSSPESKMMMNLPHERVSDL